MWTEAKAYRMRATSFAVLLLLSYILAVVAARAVDEDTSIGPALTLPEQLAVDKGLV
jgi:hypothetical protein